METPYPPKIQQAMNEDFKKLQEDIAQLKTGGKSRKNKTKSKKKKMLRKPNKTNKYKTNKK